VVRCVAFSGLRVAINVPTCLRISVGADRRACVIL
jgi:hypothetical protein